MPALPPPELCPRCHFYVSHPGQSPLGLSAVRSAHCRSFGDDNWTAASEVNKQALSDASAGVLLIPSYFRIPKKALLLLRSYGIYTIR